MRKRHLILLSLFLCGCEPARVTPLTPTPDLNAIGPQPTPTFLCCTATPPHTPSATGIPLPTETLPLTASPAPLFMVYGDGPIIPHGQAGTWDDRFTDPGAVIFHDGQFHMFHNGFRDWPASVQIGYVTSPDGYTWAKQGDEPVLKSSDVPYAGVAALASSVLVEADGTWVLYFYTWQSKTNRAGGIRRATARRPAGPWTPDAELVLTPGPSGAWDSSQVLSPHVLKTEDGYVMYYSGLNWAGIEMIGMAASPDGVRWMKYDDPATSESRYAESDPVFTPAEGRAWDAGWVHQPRVFQTADGWVMFYRGLDKPQGLKMALGYATSTDGIRWERSARNPILTPRAVPRAQYFWFTNVLFHEGAYFLFWEIDISQQTEIYLATYAGVLP